ncbi:MAG: right-handed parallel beta-helix repeat-containing protein, partial [Candidatus Hodarchaeales archaeon]
TIKGFKSSFYELHQPIEISSDEQLAENAVKGSGSELDPYILEKWRINAKGHKYGIYIQGTTKHFIIRECWLEAESSLVDIGILIEKVSPGTVTIEDNVVERCWKGIVVRNINSTKICNNTVRYNGGYGIAYYGVYYHDANDTSAITYDTIIANNTCSQNFHIGIYVFYIDNCSIVGNLISDNRGWGLYYVGGGNNYINENSFIHNKDQVWIYRTIFVVGGDIQHVSYQHFLLGMFNENYWSDYKGTGNYTVWYEDYSPNKIEVLDLSPQKTSPHEYSPPKMYLIEIISFSVMILVLGVLGGILITKNLPQVISNESTIRNVYITLIRSGLAILVLQNTLILIFVFNFKGMDSFNRLNLISFGIFNLDLIGFGLLGIGYLFYSTLSTQVKEQFMQGGAFFIGWVVCRIVTQYIIPFGFVLHEYGEPLDHQTFALYLVYRGIYESWYRVRFPYEHYSGFDIPSVLLLLTFLVAGLFLYKASRTIPQEYDERGVTLFKWYGIVNVITIFTLPLIYYQESNLIGIFTYNLYAHQGSLLIKVVLIPILGICAFGYMLRETKLMKSMPS